MQKLIRLLNRIYYKILRNIPFTENKLIKIKAGPNKGYMFNVSIGNPYIFGSYEIDSLDFILDKINREDVVYDLGANAGYYAMAMAQRTDKMVYAFEPIPENVARLKTHLRVNNIKNIQIHEIAISDKPGFIKFSNISSLVGNTYIKESKHFKETKEALEVKTNTIDELVFQKHTIPAPNIIKIDVEGAEFDVLKGAEKTLKQFKPLLLLATHDYHLAGVKDDCIAFLQKLKYQLTKTDEKKHTAGLEDFIAIHPENNRVKALSGQVN